MTTAALTFAELIASRHDDDRPGLAHGDERWSWREVIGEAARRAGVAQTVRRAGRPWHVGLLLENSPENLFWLLGCGGAGATVVGINPTRRGSELARDITFTDCQLVVTDSAHRPLLDGLDLDCEIVVVDEPGFAERLASATPADLPAAAAAVAPDTIFSLVFTSGTTAAPKAVICGQGRLGLTARQQQERRGLTAADVFYVAMPMFHSNAIMAGIAPAVSAGGCIALRRKFSASAFIDDIRRYGATFFNYVGKPLSFILATPERADDAENPLRIAFGNEANEQDIAEFARRFDCTVIDSYGSSEGGMRINRVPEAPRGSLGIADEGTVVMNPETLQECPPAQFDAAGKLLNAEEAIGEIVNTRNAADFEGYYNNAEANADRIRHGWLWSGDLAYRDAQGYWYFAGRTADWLRVDGENFAAAPVERLLARFDPFAHVAVYAVPDPTVGDQVMATVELRSGHEFDPSAFGEFLSAQEDLGTKWAPRFLRITQALPRTPTSKVLKRTLQSEGMDTADLIYVREGRGHDYELLTRSPV